MGTTGCWAGQALGGVWAAIVARWPLCTAHVIIQMPFCAPNSKLMAAPSLVTLTLPPSCSTTEYPPTPPLTCALVLTHPPMPGCSSVP